MRVWETLETEVGSASGKCSTYPCQKDHNLGSGYLTGTTSSGCWHHNCLCNALQIVLFHAFWLTNLQLPACGFWFPFCPLHGKPKVQKSSTFKDSALGQSPLGTGTQTLQLLTLFWDYSGMIFLNSISQSLPLRFSHFPLFSASSCLHLSFPNINRFVREAVVKPADPDLTLLCK